MKHKLLITIDPISASVWFDADGTAASWWTAEERARRSESDQGIGKAIKEELGRKPEDPVALETYLQNAEAMSRALRAAFYERRPGLAKRAAALEDAFDKAAAVRRR